MVASEHLAGPWQGRIGTAAVAGAIATSRGDGERGPPYGAQHVVMLGDPVADDMDDLAFLLQASPHRDHRR